MAETKLRPHHVLSYIAHEIAEGKGANLFEMSDAEYIGLFRQSRGNFHSEKTILHFRDTLKMLHENQDLEFYYVQGVDDSVCDKCEHNSKCGNPRHEYHRIDQKEDGKAIKLLPGLEFGKSYSGRYLKGFMQRVEKENPWKQSC